MEPKNRNRQTARKPCCLADKINKCIKDNTNKRKEKSNKDKKQSSKKLNDSKKLSKSDLKTIVENQPELPAYQSRQYDYQVDHDRDEYIDYFKYVKKVDPNKSAFKNKENNNINNNRVIIKVKNIKNEKEENDSFSSSNNTESTNLSQDGSENNYKKE